jgi:hypothetical protein
MPEEDVGHLMFVVVGATLRAEAMDRPLAYRLLDQVSERLRNRPDTLECLVISDIWYLNSEPLQKRPAISLGGPGVNHLSGYLYRKLETVLSVDNVLLIQISMGEPAPRCCVWGMDHDSTVEALDTFVQKGYLDRFLEACRPETNQ